MARKRITFDAVRKIGLALPGSEEGTSYGTAALKVKGKLFARLKEDGESLVLRTDLEHRDELIASDPDVYYVTDHYLDYPWVLVHLSRIHEDALKDMIAAAHKLARGASSTRRGSR